MEEEEMMKWFSYEHLPDDLKKISAPFGELAGLIHAMTEAGPERTVAFRKLREAKDAAVRARIHPGG